jgi:hypothetical protein
MADKYKELIILSIKEVCELLRVSDSWLMKNRNKIFYEKKDVLTWFNKNKLKQQSEKN